MLVLVWSSRRALDIIVHVRRYPRFVTGLTAGLGAALVLGGVRCGARKER